jgi:hypothetical protein
MIRQIDFAQVKCVNVYTEKIEGVSSRFELLMWVKRFNLDGLDQPHGVL